MTTINEEYKLINDMMIQHHVDKKLINEELKDKFIILNEINKKEEDEKKKKKLKKKS